MSNNTDLSMVLANRNIIPESCLSYSEEALYVSEHMRENYNEAFKYIGSFELAVFEETGFMIQYNGPKSINMLHDELCGIYENDFSAIKGFWMNVLEDFKSQIDKTSKYQIGALIEESDITKDSYGETHTFFDPEKIKFYENTEKFIKLVEKRFSSLKDADYDTITSAKNELDSKICSIISGIDGVDNVRDMNSALKEKLTGKQVTATKAYVKRHLEDMKELTSGGLSLKIANDSYNKEKSAIKSAMADARKACSDNSKVIAAWHSVLTNTLSALHACYAVEIDVYKRQFKEYRNILARCKKDNIQ